MCQHFHLLAEHSRDCFVARCEHGTIHLGWGGSIWLLSTQELLDLTRFVSAPPQTRASARFTFEQAHPDSPRAVLWSGERALAFTVTGVQAFRALLLTAGHSLEGPQWHVNGGLSPALN